MPDGTSLYRKPGYTLRKSYFISASATALLIAAAGLIGRAALDKILALKGGADLVSNWAQIISLTELFISPIAAGVGLGLTALMSRTDCHISRQEILSGAWRAFSICIMISGVITLAAGTFAIESTAQRWAILGATIIAGLAGAYFTMLNAWWAGQQERWRIVTYQALNAGLICITALISAELDILTNVITTQAMIAVAFLLYGQHKHRHNSSHIKKIAHEQIYRYIWAGVVIGFFSPLSLLIIRHTLDQTGPTDSAGMIQSIWRVSEWVATPAVAILTTFFLPEMSKHYGQSIFKKLFMQYGSYILILSALGYGLIYVLQVDLFTLFYNSTFIPSSKVLAYFLIGDWFRIASWICLFTFYANTHIRWIVIGEFFSLPLLTGALLFLPTGYSLETVSITYTGVYIIYFIFNIVAILYEFKRQPSNMSCRTN